MARFSSTKPNVDFATKVMVNSMQTGTFPCVQTGGVYQNVGNGFSISITETGLYRISCKFNADLPYSSVTDNSIRYRLAVDGVEINGTPGVAYKNVAGGVALPVFIETVIQSFTAGQVITLQAYKTNTDLAQVYYNSGSYEGFIQAELVDKIVPVSRNTPWIPYVTTITGSIANPTKGTIACDKSYYRVVDGYCEVMYNYRQTASGANGTGLYYFSKPPGIVVDTSMFDPNPPQNGNIIGIATAYGSGSGVGNGKVIYDVVGNIQMNINNSVVQGSSTYWGLGVNDVSYQARMRIPIL